MREPYDAPTETMRDWLIVTDLDGTLLDEETYSFAPALPALRELTKRGVGLVLASSKTLPEMEFLAGTLEIRPPLIVENGGAVLVPRADHGYDRIALGVERATLVHALEEIGREAGAAPRGFSALTARAVATVTGLDPAAALRAMDRAYDEPFLLEDDSRLASIEEGAARRGLRVSRGGRFFHLTGDTDKGRALRVLLTVLERPGKQLTTVGLGDAGNDLPLLRAVDRPIVIPRRIGGVDATLARELPQAERAPAPGPVGWNAAVLAVLDGRRLPLVGVADGC